MLTFVAPLIIYLLSFPVMMLTLRRVEIGILFFISIIPIIAVMKKIVQFPAGHNFADLLLISLVLGWILNSARENKKMFLSSPVNVFVILLVLWSFISLIRGYTLIELPEDVNLLRLKTWKNYMILPVVYFVAMNNIDTEKKVKWIIICISLSLIACDFNFYSTFKWLKSYHYSHDIRIPGPFSFLGPNEMGIFFCMNTFMLLGISYFIENKKFKYFLLLVCAANFYPILYSYSRVSYVCALVGFLTLGLLKDRRLLIVPIIVVYLYSYILPNSVVERIDMTFLDKEETSEEILKRSAFDIGDTTIEITGRKALWEKATNYFEEHPILGSGFDTFRHLEGAITHSLFYSILAEEGLIGLLVNLFFYLAIMKQSYKLFRNSKIKLGRGIGLGFFISVIVFLVGTSSGDMSLYYNLMSIFWVFLGIVASFNIHYTNNKNPGSSPIG